MRLALAASLLCSGVALADGELAMLSQGAQMSAGIGTSAVGDDLMLELGGETMGVRSFRGHRWLLHWEAFVAVKGGYLANEHPYLPLLGAYGRGSAELGYRLRPEQRWSAYAGARVNGDLQAMASPGVPADALSTLNSTDGFGGITADIGLRIDAGLSLLDARHALLLVLFLQEAVRTAELHAAAAAFLEGGLEARLDIVRRVNAYVAVAWGKTPNLFNAGLDETDQTTHEEVVAGVRRSFDNQWWVSAAVSFSQDTDHLAYAGGQSFSTADAPSFAFTVSVGLPLGVQW